MAEMLQVIEGIRQEEASLLKLFGGEGRRVRTVEAKAKYKKRLAEAAKFIHAVQMGRMPVHYLEEAMSRSDFPILFGDVLDRQLLGYYKETTPTWSLYALKDTVPDFRNVKRIAEDGMEGVFGEVDELEEYPQRSMVESVDEYHVKKLGTRADLSWEALINDDLGAFGRIPARLARAARRTESKMATELFVDSKGPHAELYKAEFKNVVEGNPKLSIESLQKAFTLLSKMVDQDEEPIEIDMVTLVVPPALKVTAENILNALSADVNTEGGTEKQRLRIQNWMKNSVTLAVEPYIPHVATKENGDTSWFLFANPDTSRPAIVLGFLRGYEQPGLFERIPTSRRVGGGGEDMVSFDNDSRAWKVRHVLGGTRLTKTGGFRATVASNGSGS
jgi:hypothetical protein